jgi:hypothetical protein
MKRLKMFNTRVPLFMYLSEYREKSLRDVIVALQQTLFKEVVGITPDEFQKLENAGLFNIGN